MRLTWIVLLVTAAVASASVGAGGAVVPRPVVGCDDQVGTAEQPYKEAGIVLDRIGLPRGRYPWPLARGPGRFRWWGKWGALLRAGTTEPVTISIARPWRRHARIGWGNAGGLSVTFAPCSSSATWIVYAGGFELKKRGCVPFDVQVGEQIQRIRIAFGRRC